MRNPLIPFDGSAAALRALDHALQEMRGQADGQVHVLNVQPPMRQLGPSRLVTPDMIAAELRSEGLQLLTQAQNKVQAAGLTCVPQVRIGAAAEEIAAYAAEHGCEAIVMGSRGMGSVAGLVLGSVAHKVLHLAQVPVTMVK